MDWLLRIAIARLIGRGTLRLTTARGTLLTFGDGNGPTVSARFTSIWAELAVMLDTFQPLRLTTESLNLEDETYSYSWQPR